MDYVKCNMYHVSWNKNNDVRCKFKTHDVKIKLITIETGIRKSKINAGKKIISTYFASLVHVSHQYVKISIRYTSLHTKNMSKFKFNILKIGTHFVRVVFRAELVNF